MEMKPPARASGNLIANTLGFQPATSFEIADPARRGMPQVQL